MKPSRAIQLLRLTGLVGLMYASVGTVLAAPKPEAKVDVFAKHSGGKIVYSYRVFNKSRRNITSVSIGLDTRNDEHPVNDIYELYELPSGWNEKFGIPSTSSTSPTGWRTILTKPEDSDTHAITWEPVNENKPRLLAGHTTRMRVALDRAATNYMAGHASVTFTEGFPLRLTVPIESLDITPPELVVTLTPNRLRSPSKSTVPVLATFTLTDDYDPKPEIKLESITADEPLEANDILDASFGVDDRYLLLRANNSFFSERNYTVTYSATDASGNMVFASASVTIQDDRAENILPTEQEPEE